MVDDPVKELSEWIAERRAFRETLDSMGDLHKWTRDKPTLTDIEMLVMERTEVSKLHVCPAQAMESTVSSTLVLCIY